MIQKMALNLKTTMAAKSNTASNTVLMTTSLVLALTGSTLAQAQNVTSAKSCNEVFAKGKRRATDYVPKHAPSLSPAADSPLGYQLTLPLSSLPKNEQAALLRDFKLNSVGVVNTGMAKPFRASATLWGKYGEFVVIKTAKHVSDAGIQFFQMGGLNGAEPVSFDVVKNHGVKLFDDPVTDVTIYGFPAVEYSQAQFNTLDAVTPSFLPLALELLRSPEPQLVVAGRASQPSAVGDAGTFANLNLYNPDATSLWQSAALEANAPGNLDARPTGAQGDVLAVARTSLVSPLSARIPDPDGIAPVSGGATTNPQQPYLPSTLITQVYAFDYRSVGRMSGGSVLMHVKNGEPRDVASHITKGLPQEISKLDLKNPYGTWEAEKGDDGKPTGKFKLLTPAPYAYASDYTTFAKVLTIYLVKQGRQLPPAQASALAELLARGLKP